MARSTSMVSSSAFLRGSGLVWLPHLRELTQRWSCTQSSLPCLSRLPHLHLNLNHRTILTPLVLQYRSLRRDDLFDRVLSTRRWGLVLGYRMRRRRSSSCSTYRRKGRKPSSVGRQGASSRLSPSARPARPKTKS